MTIRNFKFNEIFVWIAVPTKTLFLMTVYTRVYESNKLVLYFLSHLSLYQFIKASGRHKYVVAHCVHELGDLKKI